jgi:hypothetical protein
MFGQLSETYKFIFSSCCQKQLGTLQKFPENLLKFFLIKHFQDAQNISGSFGIICTIMLGILETLNFLKFCSQKCEALWKNLNDPKKINKINKLGSLGI